MLQGKDNFKIHYEIELRWVPVAYPSKVRYDTTISLPLGTNDLFLDFGLDKSSCRGNKKRDFFCKKQRMPSHMGRPPYQSACPDIMNPHLREGSVKVQVGVYKSWVLIVSDISPALTQRLLT